MKTYTRKDGSRTQHSDAWILEKTPHHLKSSIDMDYVDQLNPEEAKFLSDFSKSYYCGMVTAVNKDWTKEEKKECFDRNNANRRDVFTNLRRTRTLKPLEKCTENAADGYGLAKRGKQQTKKESKND